MQRKKTLPHDNTAVYWRSDTRSPEEIFNTGFKAQSPKSDNFWKESLRVDDRDGTCDAISSNCVCMTTNFASAGIFPVTKMSDVVYFYAIALPMPLKINSSKELDNGSSIPVNSEQAVIDLHSFQTAYAYNRTKNIDKNATQYRYRILNECRFLYAYEAIASRVDTKNIIGAIKVLRSPYQNQDCIDLPDRSFSVLPNIYINKAFTATQEITVLFNGGSASNLILDYSERQEEAIKQFNHAAKISKFETPSTQYGLGGKTIGLFARIRENTEIPKIPGILVTNDLSLRVVQCTDALTQEPKQPLMFIIP